jgi:hypothetical protein
VLNHGKDIFDGRYNTVDYNLLPPTGKVGHAGGTKVIRRRASEKEAGDSFRFRFPGNESAFWGVKKGVFESKNRL